MLFKDWLPTAYNYFAAACMFCVALGMFDRLVRVPFPRHIFPLALATPLV